MISKVFAVFDNKAKAFALPFYSPTIATAVRDFTSASNDPASSLNAYPSDYTLFHIADYDNESALMSPVVPIVNLGLAAQFISGVKSENHV